MNINIEKLTVKQRAALFYRVSTYRIKKNLCAIATYDFAQNNKTIVTFASAGQVTSAHKMMRFATFLPPWKASPFDQIFQFEIPGTVFLGYKINKKTADGRLFAVLTHFYLLRSCSTTLKLKKKKTRCIKKDDDIPFYQPSKLLHA